MVSMIASSMEEEVDDLVLLPMIIEIIPHDVVLQVGTGMSTWPVGRYGLR